MIDRKLTRWESSRQPISACIYAGSDGRNVDPDKDLLFYRDLPLDYLTYIDIIRGEREGLPPPSVVYICRNLNFWQQAPMRFRKLRIAWSVVCGIACVLLIALWVRSYWWAMTSVQLTQEITLDTSVSTGKIGVQRITGPVLAMGFGSVPVSSSNGYSAYLFANFDDLANAPYAWIFAGEYAAMGG